MMRAAALRLALIGLLFAGEPPSGRAEIVEPLPDLPSVISFVLRSGIEPCWSPPPGVTGEIVVRIQLSREMTVIGEPELISPRSSDPVLEASVRRAILRCAPFKGLRNYIGNYELWRDVELRFDSSAP